MTSLLTLFTSIAIFIGCLGLFGLVSFMTNQKTKEIGVRKVLGASVENILFAFGWNYIRLILVGFLIALPIGWFVMEQFLNEFAYRITLGPSIFISAFLVTIVIALATVGYKTFRAAAENPVKSLRYE
jgi:ABC-type antimicrobial peptide transport system permease subunit